MVVSFLGLLDKNRGPYHLVVELLGTLLTRTGWSVGCLPLPKMGALKCYGQYIVRNTLDYPAGTGSESLSTPPMQPDYAQWDVSPLLQDDVRWALRSLLGEKKSYMKMENFRICWSVPVVI